jgi:hypothetical protein
VPLSAGGAHVDRAQRIILGEGLRRAAVQQVGSYLRNTGRHTNVVETAACDPVRKLSVHCSNQTHCAAQEPLPHA